MSSFVYANENQIKDFRPIPFYFITTTDPNELSYEAVRKSMVTLKEEGFGGIVLFNKPPHGFDEKDYLGDAWFDMIRNFARVCKELELKLWINDALNYPPGSAGGRINRRDYPHLAPKRLVLLDGEVTSAEVDWGFPAFELPESAELFHQIVHEAYLREVGEYFGDPICGFFSDADNRRVNFRVFKKDSPQRNYFPWSDNFAETFEKEYGYHITPYLKKIMAKETCPQAIDYWEHAGRLYQSWFKSNHEWLNAHGLKYTFHTSDSAPFTWDKAPRCSLYTEGRALDMESNCDYPGTDQELLEINGGKHMRQEELWVPRCSWGEENPQVQNKEYYKVYSDLRTKQAGSSAFLYHKKGAMCEMFAASNWGATFTQLREIAAWQVMQGITFIVPHAYHHRLRGDRKGFAPPIFGKGSALNYGAKQLNDTLATYCYYASRGKLKAPIAVLDITDSIWEGRTTESDTLFSVCEKLNRMPYGYVLADVKSILANKEEFSVIINTGAPLSETMKEALAPANLPIIGADELDKLPDLIDCEVSYEGEGIPHFMRRQLEDGSELVILASIEDGKTISGTLHMGDSAFPTYIRSGELVFFTKDGQISVDETAERYLDCPAAPTSQSDSLCQNSLNTKNVQSVRNDQIHYALAEEVPVIWEHENVLPIEYWKDENGVVTTKQSGAPIHSFTYRVDENGIRNLNLYISKRHFAAISALTLDGEPLSDKADAFVLDDPYYCWSLEKGKAVGTHTIVLKTTEALTEFDNILLQGDFGVDLHCEEPYTLFCTNQYNLDKYLPKEAEVVLTKRPTTLKTTVSWANQGHPFYSGKATYCFKLDMPQDFGEAMLCIPQVHTGCDITLDQNAIGKRIFLPYTFELGDMGGSHDLQITVSNTMANALEFYKAPSGITAGVFLETR